MTFGIRNSGLSLPDLSRQPMVPRIHAKEHVAPWIAGTSPAKTKNDTNQKISLDSHSHLFYLRSHRFLDEVPIMTVIMDGKRGGPAGKAVACPQALGRGGCDLGTLRSQAHWARPAPANGRLFGGPRHPCKPVGAGLSRRSQRPASSAGPSRNKAPGLSPRHSSHCRQRGGRTASHRGGALPEHFICILIIVPRAQIGRGQLAANASRGRHLTDCSP
jgi:hypothetical protein